MKATEKIIGRLIVGCVLACWLISNIYAQTTAKAVQSVSADDMEFAGGGSNHTTASEISSPMRNVLQRPDADLGPPLPSQYQ